MAPLARQYVQSLGSAASKASVIGTAIKCHPRFAAFANGVWIHADGYDDTQLAVAKDRIYGPLTHPTVPVLPAAFTLCEIGRRSGRDFMLAYQDRASVLCALLAVATRLLALSAGPVELIRHGGVRKLARLEIAFRGRSCTIIAVRTRSLPVRGKGFSLLAR